MKRSQMSLYLATLSCQNSGCTDLICTKPKTMFRLTKFLKVHYTIAWVARPVHSDKGCRTLSIVIVPIPNDICCMFPHNEWSFTESKLLVHFQSHSDIPYLPLTPMGKKQNSIFHMTVKQNLGEQNPICLYTKCGSAYDLVMLLCCTELPCPMHSGVS